MEIKINGVEYVPKEEELITQIIQAKTIKWGKTADKMINWVEAKEWCAEQGGRLPTRLELLQAYIDKVEGFQADYYWSSTEYNTYNAWGQSFDTGYQASYTKADASYVRCVFE